VVGSGAPVPPPLASERREGQGRGARERKERQAGWVGLI